MDGAVGVTQCPIPPGQTFLYDFTVEQSGTYWYHSHSGGQYSDGLRSLVIVHDPEMESKYAFDKQVYLSVSDWYHQTSDVLEKRQLTRYNPTGAEPVPDSSLFNDTKNVTLGVEPETTYLVRIANVGVMVSQYLFIEDHEFDIIEVDGVYTKPAKAKMVYLGVGQRVSILLRTKKLSEVAKKFCIVQSFDTSMLDVVPKKLEVTSINYLSYDDDLPKSIPSKEFYDIESYEAFDDFNLRPIDGQPLLPEPDHVLKLNLHMENLGDGVNYAFFNNLTYVAPKVPTMLTAITAPEDLVMNSKIYGDNTNALILNFGEIVDLVIDNDDSNKHPLHVHGHKYQVVTRSPEYETPHHFSYDNATFPEHPCVRDTVMVNTYGNTVIRFKADNPGVWFFHCHLDFHLEQGLAVVLVEAPDMIREFIDYDSLSESYLASCRGSNTATRGNAAANAEDWLDLSGQNTQPNDLPEGFTTKGYIAMAVCILSALWGLWEIAVYGMDDLKHSFQDNLDHEKLVVKDLIIQLTRESEMMNLESRRRKKMDQMLEELKELDGKFEGLQ
ncbi:DEKNAAC103352 [Brettanomyces naardenensis]|uniref:DEKNAAC103352 n=1 Tax=Brettanomyces naardenensis TaxID=13370 RepID=A0A448YNV9_BRENA|nr:DEKNAAC103352 [Brettanomyces naardenensis]